MSELGTTEQERAEWAARAEQCGPMHSPVSLSWQQSHRLICDVDRLVEVIEKVNTIRNRIVGRQAVNWSADIYPLVAALNEAGFEGLGFEEARAALALEGREDVVRIGGESQECFGCPMASGTHWHRSEMTLVFKDPDPEAGNYVGAWH